MTSKYIMIVLGASFFLVLENLGWLTRKVALWGRHESVDRDQPLFTINTVIGLVTYAVIFMGIGMLGLLSKPLVLTLSALPVGLIAFRLEEYKQYGLALWRNKFIVAGCLALLYITRFNIHRPTLLFDGLWYHMPIPKQYLQDGTVGYTGGRMRYAASMFANLFWNLYPLSLPIPTVNAGIVINWFQGIFIALGGYSAGWLGKKHFGFNWLWQFTAPVLIGITTTGLFYIGSGYNDLYGFTISIICLVYLLYMRIEKKDTPPYLLVAVLLITALGLVKTFFAVQAAILVMYLLFTIWEHYRFGPRFRSLVLILFSTGLVAVLPWLLRTYYYTGYPLFPAGSEQIVNDVLDNIGVASEAEYFGDYVWDRFFQDLPRLLVLNFSPLVLCGVIGGALVSKYKAVRELWLVFVVSFVVGIFISVKLNARYLFGPAGGLMLLGLLWLHSLGKKLGLFASLLVLLLPVAFLPYAFRYNLSRGDYQSREFLSTNKTPDLYVNDNLIKHLGYYKSSRTVAPYNYSEDDTLYVSGFVFTAYIDNEFYTYLEHQEKFQGLRTVSDFKKRLEELGVDYLVVRDGSLQIDCDYLNLVDRDNCQEQFEIEVYDSSHDVFWLRVD